MLGSAVTESTDVIIQNPQPLRKGVEIGMAQRT